ncbi:uncharacterized protein TM35_000182830 [Trypanosoma theileri]|uniref:Uncharacterized protein n=1 Tax=Trypanosoma theileri TaxID=67003 RepID=A0A1X0NU39_9TRYP|nr:uncharacterized protein TM35_000182830 [Trypanosoma theileri]ORC88226.1 hypothetical protein TM35_000182830 [Trypanosoma theileri]
MGTVSSKSSTSTRPIGSVDEVPNHVRPSCTAVSRKTTELCEFCGYGGAHAAAAAYTVPLTRSFVAPPRGRKRKKEEKQSPSPEPNPTREKGFSSERAAGRGMKRNRGGRPQKREKGRAAPPAPSSVEVVGGRSPRGVARLFWVWGLLFAGDWFFCWVLCGGGLRFYCCEMGVV